MKVQCATCLAVFDERDAVIVTEWEPTESPGFPGGSEVRIQHCPECDSDQIFDYEGEEEC